MTVTGNHSVGRPALSGGGKDAFYRISPYLCIAFGLRRGDSDSEIIKSRLIQAIGLLAHKPDSAVCKVDPQRSEYGMNRKGWSTSVTQFNIWMTEALASAIDSILPGMVEYQGDVPCKVDSIAIKKLLAIAAAAEGYIQPENWTAPLYQDYLASENPQADFLGLRVEEE